MGEIVNLTRNAEVLQGFQMETSADMHTVVAWGESRGYAGHINLDPNGIWSMSLTAPNGTAHPGRIGDWVVIKNDASAVIVPQEQAPSLYSIVP